MRISCSLSLFLCYSFFLCDSADGPSTKGRFLNHDRWLNRLLCNDYITKSVKCKDAEPGKERTIAAAGSHLCPADTSLYTCQANPSRSSIAFPHPLWLRQNIGPSLPKPIRANAVLPNCPGYAVLGGIESLHTALLPLFR